MILLTTVSLASVMIVTAALFHLARRAAGQWSTPFRPRALPPGTPRSLVSDDVDVVDADHRPLRGSRARPHPATHRDGDRAGGEESDRPPALARRAGLHSAAQVLFAEVDEGTLWVDCVFVDDAPQGVSPGSLLTLRLATPGVLGLDAPIEAVVQRWAGDASVVDLHLRPMRNGWRVLLDDGDTKVNLEVYDAVGAS